jgi:hypothetical protein
MCPKLGGDLFAGEVLIVGCNVQDDAAGSGKLHPRVVARRGQVSVSQPITTIAVRVRVRGWVTRLLRAHGFDVVAEPESFLVTKQDLLDPQETTRARDWGTKLAAGIARAEHKAPGAEHEARAGIAHQPRRIGAAGKRTGWASGWTQIILAHFPLP